MRRADVEVCATAHARRLGGWQPQFDAGLDVCGIGDLASGLPSPFDGRLRLRWRVFDGALSRARLSSMVENADARRPCFRRDWLPPIPRDSLRNAFSHACLTFTSKSSKESHAHIT